MISASVFWSYIVLGLIFIIFSKQISSYLYKIILIYTSKAKLNDLFIFKVDDSNQDFMYKVARVFLLVFGLSLFLFSIYYFFYFK